MKGDRGIMKTTRQRLQLPNTMSTPRIPFRGGAKRDFQAKAISFQKGVFAVQTPIIPFLQGTQRLDLRVRGTETNAARRFH